MTRDELIAFEEEMAALFNAGEIKAPLHLAGGNEDQLIEIFASIRPQDWVLCSWRSHYHCLLKGVPPDLLRQRIMDGRSIALCFAEYRVLSSAIVGGICPIAVGIAAGIKARDEDARVWCFIGDMTAMSGIHRECEQYVSGHNLPLNFVIEDNGVSVCTSTRKAWGPEFNDVAWMANGKRVAIRYRYVLNRPHVGTGKWVAF